MSKSVSEVEEILREIRLRVQHDNLESTQIERKAAEKSPLEVRPAADVEPDSRAVSPDSVHLQSRLLTLERTGSNLPPIISNRTGLAARAELFVKRQIKRMTKWFTWDQVIFNTAVHESLVELQKIQISNACEHARLLEILARIEKAGADTSTEIEELENSMRGRLGQLGELQERLGQLADQQTVIYKNLLIQMSEASAASERSRHSLEERLTALENDSRSS